MCDNQAVTRSISALSFHHHCPKSVVLQCYASKSDSDSVKKKQQHDLNTRVLQHNVLQPLLPNISCLFIYFLQ